jgi:hypothetical protein
MTHFDDSFRKDLMDLWQHDTATENGDPSVITRQLSSALKKFDQRIFWRNAIEYAAAVIVLIRSFFDIASGERLLIAPLTSIAVALFIGVNVWRKHRIAAPVDPTANAHEYRIALVDRIDRQIQFIRGVPY